MKKIVIAFVLYATIIMLFGCSEETYKEYIYIGESEHWTAEFIVEINPHLSGKSSEFKIQNRDYFGIPNLIEVSEVKEDFESFPIGTRQMIFLTYKNEEGLANVERLVIHVDTPYGGFSSVQGVGIVPNRVFGAGGGGYKRPYRGNESISATVIWLDHQEVLELKAKN